MRPTLEAIFRHPILLLSLIILLPIVGVAVAYLNVPRTYQSTASVWALQRYFVVGATGPESDLTSTPAETQASALDELLQTRAFTQAVVKDINLGSVLGLSQSAIDDPRQLLDEEFSDISSHVLATPSAYNLFVISYTSRDPKIAQQVVNSVINTFGKQSLGLSIAEGQNLLASYQTQLAGAQKNLNNSVAAETKYVDANPNLKLGSDPQYALLETQRIQALSNVQGIQNIINNIQQSIINAQGTGTTTLFQVIDAPQIPNRPLSRTKDFMYGGGLGLAIALLTYIIYLVIVVRRNQGVYSTHDLQDFVAFPVVMKLPSLSAASVSQLTTKPMQDQALLADRKSSANGHVTRSGE